MSGLPLSRIRILDFSLVWAGPFAVMMLGDLGAEIVRVESRRHHITNTRGFVPWPPDKEFVARLGHMAGGYVDKDPAGNPWNRHALFNSLGRNRRSVVAEIGTEEGHRTVEELVKVCDVLIENNSMGMMARHGLDYESVRKLNPSIIYVTMPLYGLTGPYHQHVGFGSQGEATAGYLLLRGYEDDGPMTNHGSNHMDASSGIAAAYATLMGIYQRDRTGESQFIEVSQTEHMTHQVGGALMDAAMNGRDRTPIGNRDEFRAPQGVYRCRGEDRWVAVSVGRDEEWSGLCKALGRPDLADDPAYLGNLARRGRHDEIDTMISAWSADLEDRDAMERLQAHGVPAGMLSDDADPYFDPHLEARGFYREMEQAACGRHRYPGHVFQFAGKELRFESPPPLLGEHNDWVYGDLLGVPAAEIERQKELGLIGEGYLPTVK